MLSVSPCPLTLTSSPLERNQFCCRFSGLLARHVFHKLDRAWRIVLILVSLADQILQPLTACVNRADRNFAVSDEDSSRRIFQERPVPTARLQAPGAYEDASFHDHRPNADRSMRLAASPKAQNLLFVDSCKNIGSEPLLGVHSSIPLISSLHPPTPSATNRVHRRKSAARAGRSTLKRSSGSRRWRNSIVHLQSNERTGRTC